MHSLEPFYNWRDFYIASEDARSPFFGREYSEFEFTHAIYDHVIHPQWDSFGSNTLFLKVLYCDYEQETAIIEFIGEWNDLLYSDIDILKREFIDDLIEQGINKYILIMENVLNFHADNDCYYEEWFEDVFGDDGYICTINLRQQVMDEMQQVGIDNYLLSGGKLADIAWRTKTPQRFISEVNEHVQKRLMF